MNILIIGVSGFIGQHLYHALSQEGHYLTGCSRHKVADIHWQPFSFGQSQKQWEQQLQTIDLVINAAGIYQQSEQQRIDKEGFSYVHDLGPKLLFAACSKHQIKVIQISAIGAHQDKPVTEFLQSKYNADHYLMKQKLPNIVLYPGIVLGERGRTTQQLALLASLYCKPLVFGRKKKLPLISIYQLTDIIKGYINNWPEVQISEVLAARPETMETLLTNLRHWLGLKKGYFFVVPKQLINFIFYLFPNLSFGAFNKQSIAMLANYSDKTKPEGSIKINESASESLLKHQATGCFKKDLQISLLFYLNLFILGFIWLVSGISSLVNIEQSRELISLIAIEAGRGDIIIAIAAIGDCLLGLFLWAGLYSPQLRPWAIYSQLGVMIIYTLIISIMMPMYWLHPFAPVVKNLALFVLTMYLLVEKERSCNYV